MFSHYCHKISANIEYIKWDMNRPLTEVFSQGECDEFRSLKECGQTGPVKQLIQAETSHRFVLGLYELQDRITKAFPYILLENCSSGG